MAADSPIVGYALSQTNGQLERFGDTYDSAPRASRSPSTTRQTWPTWSSRP